MFDVLSVKPFLWLFQFESSVIWFSFIRYESFGQTYQITEYRIEYRGQVLSLYWQLQFHSDL